MRADHHEKYVRRGKIKAAVRGQRLKYENRASAAACGTHGFSAPVSGDAVRGVRFTLQGFIMGTAVKMFSIAGPVIVYGVSASVVYGLILVLFGAA